MTVAEARSKVWHRADRPEWDCVICGQPWPCAPAKVTLAEEYRQDRVSLILYLTIHMLDAIDDSFGRGGPEPADLWDRFLGWAPVGCARSSRDQGDEGRAVAL